MAHIFYEMRRKLVLKNFFHVTKIGIQFIVGWQLPESHPMGNPGFYHFTIETHKQNSDNQVYTKLPRV